MPIYEYEREDGTRFEKIHRAGEDPLEACPETGQKVRRLVSASAFHLKGSGWYKTDYAASGGDSSGESGSDKGDSDSEGSGGGDSGGSSDSSSDSKKADSSSSDSSKVKEKGSSKSSSSEAKAASDK